jgi:L-fucose mutarotase/ribose pyranase (RbsD/FucU family)
LNAILPLFGHRNWIVVADAAYPAQSKPGIETVVSGEDQIHVVQRVMDGIAASGHIRANVYVDKELDYVSEDDAPGITEYKQQLSAALHGANAERVEHEKIIARLDQFAQLFRVLVIKTVMTIPYTSVCIELDCGYWNAEAEGRLRRAMWSSAVKQKNSK